MKYLITGLGNIGDEYENTRHNIGFQILDEILRIENNRIENLRVQPLKKKKLFSFLHSGKLKFKSGRLAYIAAIRFKNHDALLIKPATFVNRSGDAVRYWLQKEKIPLENLLVIADDISLPFGTLRLRAKGSDGGHNGLKDINEVLQTNNYARLRFGIGNNFPKGGQVDYVLGQWSREEVEVLPLKIGTAVEAIKSFTMEGIEKTMTIYNH